MATLSRGCLLGLALALGTGLGGVGCRDDIVEIPHDLRGDPYCALVVGTWGHFADGSVWLIANYETESVAGGCVCATAEEIESGARDDELNDAALAECKRQAATMDFAWDECEEDHATREWLDIIILADDTSDIPPPTGLHCFGEG